MRALLDTHAFLWWIADHPSLSPTAREIIADGTNEVLLSVVSAWEIVVKAGAGRIALDESPERFVSRHVAQNGFSVLPVHLDHALKVAALPRLHRDPFDRLLVAQATAEGLPILSGDPQIAKYAVETLW